MAELAINETTTYRWSFEEDVQQYAAAGVRGIGVWRRKLADYGEEKGIELLAEKGLQVSSLLWAGGFTGSDGRTHKESIFDARHAIRLAASLAAKCLIVHSGARAGHTHNHARRLLKTALSELIPFAVEFGITLAIEPMHRECAGEWTFLTDVDEAIRVIDAANCPYVKLAFDVYHMAQDEEILDRLHEIVPYIALVQLGDCQQPPTLDQERCRLGDGTLMLDRVVPALLAAGYDGFFEVELMGQEIESCDYLDLILQSKRKFAELAGMAPTA